MCLFSVCISFKGFCSTGKHTNYHSNSKWQHKNQDANIQANAFLLRRIWRCETAKSLKKGHEVTVTRSETKEIHRIDNDGHKITGKPLDSCWIFLLASGWINTYSITSAIDGPVTPIAYIQKEDTGTIIPLTDTNVKEMVEDNEKALKLVEKKKLSKAIEVYNKN